MINKAIENDLVLMGDKCELLVQCCSALAEKIAVSEEKSMMIYRMEG